MQALGETEFQGKQKGRAGNARQWLRGGENKIVKEKLGRSKSLLKQRERLKQYEEVVWEWELGFNALGKGQDS